MLCTYGTMKNRHLGLVHSLYNSKVSCEMCCNSQNKTLTFGGSVLMEEMSRISVLLNMRVKETKL